MANRIMLGLSYPNDPHSSYEIYGLDTECHEELETQLAPGAKAASDTEFMTKMRIEGSMKGQGNPSLGGHIIKPLDALVRGGFLFLEDPVEDAVKDPGAMARPGEVLVSDDNSVGMVATLITRRKAAWRELQRHDLQRARVPLHCLHSRPQGALAASPFHAQRLRSFIKTIRSGDIDQLCPTVTPINAKEFYGFEKMSLFACLLRPDVPDVQLQQQYRMIPQIAEFPNAELCNGRLMTAPRCREFQMTVSQSYGVKRGDCLFVMNSSLWRRRSAPSKFNPKYISEVADLALALIKAGMSQKDIMILLY
ncbi:hypothetical protein BDV39DRAFT_208671 [Aspergillus sergii]|uniref:DNA2/NAM7 helicase-like C-terminal domain-containing protein n=1 Tax=Aspergillus sergii TaxID=1034303 RepID=A0A5N6WUK4_9EURO|nr:hypothetical protein BDV39DRAFT_208671 [Aspergillus sergii]